MDITGLLLLYECLFAIPAIQDFRDGSVNDFIHTAITAEFHFQLLRTVYPVCQELEPGHNIQTGFLAFGQDNAPVVIDPQLDVV
jgi:hypothetical protein